MKCNNPDLSLGVWIRTLGTADVITNKSSSTMKSDRRLIMVCLSSAYKTHSTQGQLWGSILANTKMPSPNLHVHVHSKEQQYTAILYSSAYIPQPGDLFNLIPFYTSTYGTSNAIKFSLWTIIPTYRRQTDKRGQLCGVGSACCESRCLQISPNTSKSHNMSDATENCFHLVNTCMPAPIYLIWNNNKV